MDFPMQVYTRTFSEHRASKVSLLFAQTKLAPKQATTVTRLELCAAVLLVNSPVIAQFQQVIENLGIHLAENARNILFSQYITSIE